MNDDLKRLEVARILSAIKDAKGQQKLVQVANLLAELGIIFDTPQAKAQWQNQ
jgi:hypothetical protein